MDRPIKYLTKKGEIRYRVSYYYKNSYGILKRSSKGGFLTSKAAKIFARTKEEELENNLYRIPEKLTLGNLLNMWLDVIKLHVKPTTYNFYIGACKHFKDLKDLPLINLTPKILEAFYNDKLVNGNLAFDNKPLSPTTICHINRVLGIALGYAMKNDLLMRNVASLVRLPTKKAYEYQWYTMEDISLLDKLITGTYIEWPVRLAFRLGLRRGEVSALQWQDIDFENKICTINKNLVYIGGKSYLSTPKTKYGMRKIPLSVNLSNALSHLKLKQAEEMLEAGLTQTDETNVCLTPFFNPYNPDYLTRAFKQFLKTTGKKYGLKNIRFHDLRHSFASIAIYECNIPPELVSKMLGHATSSFTVDIYGHASSNVQSFAAEKFDSQFNSLK